MKCELEDKIFGVTAGHDFEKLALEVYRYQYESNPVYGAFARSLGRTPARVETLSDIPFLPIGFFRQHAVMTGTFTPEVVYTSSGTTGPGNSRHHVKSWNLYRESFVRTFRLYYGDPADWCIAALLPSYLERKDSSLVSMAGELIRLSGDPESGFYLDEHDRLIGLLRRNAMAGKQTLLLGVTFALLDLAAAYPGPLTHTVVMETGGMKGRRKELIRQEVHDLLTSAWAIPSIHSEYGMTELLSQAYSSASGIFQAPTWMKIMIREEDDPLSLNPAGAHHPVRGLVNVVDLANLYSCAFIATDDMGILHADGSFEITGRMDASDVRGCSLMYT